MSKPWTGGEEGRGRGEKGNRGRGEGKKRVTGISGGHLGGNVVGRADGCVALHLAIRAHFDARAEIGKLLVNKVK